MRLNNTQQFKELIGEDIVCVPTGNGARGRDEDYYEIKTVVSVSRKYVKLRDFREDEYRAEDGATKSEVTRWYGGNSGYLFFATLEDYMDYKKHCELAQEVSRKVNYFNWSKLSREDLITIKKIVFGEGDGIVRSGCDVRKD